MVGFNLGVAAGERCFFNEGGAFECCFAVWSKPNQKAPGNHQGLFELLFVLLFIQQ